MNPSEDGGHDWGSMLQRGDCMFCFRAQSLLQRLFCQFLKHLIIFEFLLRGSRVVAFISFWFSPEL